MGLRNDGKIHPNVTAGWKNHQKKNRKIKHLAACLLQNHFNSKGWRTCQVPCKTGTDSDKRRAYMRRLLLTPLLYGVNVVTHPRAKKHNLEVLKNLCHIVSILFKVWSLDIVQGQPYYYRKLYAQSRSTKTYHSYFLFEYIKNIFSGFFLLYLRAFRKHIKK